MSGLPKPCLLAIGVLLAAASTDARAEPPRLTNVGTLTCTTQEKAPQAAADEILSCRFNVQNGPNADFTGTITRMGPADFPPGKRVLVWAVLATKPNVRAEAISGVYSGMTGSEASGRLVSQNAEIVLEAIASGTEAAQARTVLEIRLEPAKV